MIKENEEIKTERDIDEYDDSYTLYNETKKQIPLFLKVSLLKIWAAGAVCYFIHIGTGIVYPLDLLVIDIFVLALVIDYIVNNIIIWMHSESNPTKQYCFIERRSLLSLFVNVLYSGMIMTLIFLSFLGIGRLVDTLEINFFSDFSFGTSPLLFGLLFFLYDFILVLIKNVIKKQIQGRMN